jgi:hypothetical protein
MLRIETETSMDNLDHWALVTLGLLGSGHCVGMCGPLVLAFPGRSATWKGHAAYHLGRIAAYLLVGGCMGAAGAALARLPAAAQPLVWTARVQVLLSLLAAALLALLGLVRLGVVREPAWLDLAAPPAGAWRGGLWRRGLAGSLPALAGVGLFTGLLPCGLSFAAFAVALASGTPLAGAAAGLLFGLGTLPGLLALGLGAGGLARRYRRQSDLLAGVLMLLMAFRLLAQAAAAVAP